MKNLITKIKHFVLTDKEKAVAAAVYSAVATYAAQTHLTWEGLTNWATVWALVAAVGGHLVVYFVTNGATE